jgi:hypothetical protein
VILIREFTGDPRFECLVAQLVVFATGHCAKIILVASGAIHTLILAVKIIHLVIIVFHSVRLVGSSI